MPFPVDEKYIVQTEEKLGIIFPKSFRQRMMQNNGGEIEITDDDWQLYPFLDSSDKTRIKRTCNDIIYETNQLRQFRGFPENAIPIAANGTGDQLVFLINSSIPGILSPAIYYWDHETSQIILVANDFSECV
jgi:SMI1 / KNR4 family (SUKH-1)